MACSRKSVTCCALFWFLFGIILLSLSFKTLTPLEAGIRINGITNQISDGDKIYTAGRYAVGFLYRFISYPTTLQEIEFSQTSEDSRTLGVQTRGGQTVQLEISFHYRLKTTELLLLYRTYEQNYHTRYVTVAAQIIKEVATQFSTTDFYTNRDTIAKVMHTALNLGLQDYFAVVEHFQLKNVDLPSKTETTILAKLDQQQQVLMKEEAKKAKEVREYTSTAVSSYIQQARVVEAEKKKEATITTNTAQADAITIVLEAQTQAYSLLKTELGFTNDEMTKFLLLDYIRSQAAKSDSIAMNIDSALFSF